MSCIKKRDLEAKAVRALEEVIERFRDREIYIGGSYGRYLSLGNDWEYGDIDLYLSGECPEAKDNQVLIEGDSIGRAVPEEGNTYIFDRIKEMIGLVDVDLIFPKEISPKTGAYYVGNSLCQYVWKVLPEPFGEFSVRECLESLLIREDFLQNGTVYVYEEARKTPRHIEKLNDIVLSRNLKVKTVDYSRTYRDLKRQEEGAWAP